VVQQQGAEGAEGAEGAAGRAVDVSRRLDGKVDTFADSLVHVNMLFHRDFGAMQRKVG
jgi:hypothetical protein